MKEIDRRVQEADPASSRQMARLELDAAEAAVAEAIVTEPRGDDAPESAAAPPWPSATGRRRRGLLGLAGMTAAAAAVAALLLLGGGTSESSSKAYGAELIRFAESTPLLLLESPGWRVQSLYEYKGREGTEGTMEFVTGKPIPDESIRITTDEKFGVGEVGMLPANVRQRKVELSWRIGKLEFPRTVGHPIRLPVLGTTALVNTHAGRIIVRTKAGKRVIEPGRPGDRQMAAYWSEGGHVLELRATVPDLAAFEERLGWLTKVGSQAWLDAMPATVVKAADHEAAVREMLKGIPLSSAFKPSQIPNEGLTTDRSQVAGEVTNTVSCLWFRQWGEARRTGDEAAELEAERAMASAPRWPTVRQLEREGGSAAETLLKLVKSMPSGVWQFGPHRWRLLPKAEGLGCARLGIPLLPRKIRRQREHGGQPPPQ
jgi:hypothetical protein